MIGLTPRQATVLNFIEAYTAEHKGVAPSYAEIGLAVGIKSMGHVSEMVAALEERGRILRTPGRARTIEIVKAGAELAVTLNPEIHAAVSAYAKAEQINLDTAANELLRQVTAAGVAS